MEWFVYEHMQYYPSAEVVTAASAREAIEKVARAPMAELEARDRAAYCAEYAVFPLNTIAGLLQSNHAHAGLVERLREDGLA